MHFNEEEPKETAVRKRLELQSIFPQKGKAF